MKLEEAKTTFYEASDTLSDISRKLMFAGIAVVWIFKVSDKTAVGIPFSRTLLLPLAAFVLGLFFDIIQYLYKSIVWWLYYAVKHKGGISDEAEVDPPAILNLPTFVFFYAKIACCAYGFYYLLRYIWLALERATGG